MLLACLFVCLFSMQYLNLLPYSKPLSIDVQTLNSLTKQYSTRAEVSRGTICKGRMNRVTRLCDGCCVYIGVRICGRLYAIVTCLYHTSRNVTAVIFLYVPSVFMYS